jgi:uncharacterized protein YyaL (SSP411 family)
MMMRKCMRVVVAAAGLAVAGRCGAAVEASPSAAADLARATEVQRSIQQRFWDGRRQRYLDKAGRDGPAMMWTAGIAFSALDVASRYDPVTYRPVLTTYFQSLDKYWDRNQPLGGYEPTPTNGNGHDKYYDDNAWMAITFAEGYDVTGDKAMLERARQTTDFVLSGWDDQLGGGIWWHEAHKDGSKNTCVNAPAAVACLALARRLPAPADAAKYRATARRIVDWTRSHLQNPDGRYADNINVATGKVAHFALTYNTALMIRAELMLARQTGSAADEAEAEREARAADAYADRRTGAYHEQVKWSHLLVEADLAVARQTADRALADHVRRRARASVDADYAAWQATPSAELIDVASLARELWLLADAGTERGQAFWRRSDGPAAAVRP